MSYQEKVNDLIAKIQVKATEFSERLSELKDKNIQINFLSRSVQYLNKIARILKKNYAPEKEDDIKFHNLYIEQSTRFTKICSDFELALQLYELPYGITSVYGEYLDLDDDKRKFGTDFVIFRRNYWMYTFVHPPERQNVNFLESIYKKITSIGHIVKFYLTGDGKPPQIIFHFHNGVNDKISSYLAEQDIMVTRSLDDLKKIYYSHDYLQPDKVTYSLDLSALSILVSDYSFGETRIPSARTDKYRRESEMAIKEQKENKILQKIITLIAKHPVIVIKSVYEKFDQIVNSHGNEKEKKRWKKMVTTGLFTIKDDVKNELYETLCHYLKFNAKKNYRENLLYFCSNEYYRAVSITSIKFVGSALNNKHYYLDKINVPIFCLRGKEYYLTEDKGNQNLLLLG